MYICIKVTILTMLTFASMLILSCSGNTSLDFNNKYLFTYIQSKNVRTVAKFNTETGYLSTICTDSLCSHIKSSDCKFKNYIAGHVSGKYIYFISTDDNGITYFNEYIYLNDSVPQSVAYEYLSKIKNLNVISDF